MGVASPFGFSVTNEPKRWLHRREILGWSHPATDTVQAKVANLQVLTNTPTDWFLPQFLFKRPSFTRQRYAHLLGVGAPFGANMHVNSECRVTDVTE